MYNYIYLYTIFQILSFRFPQFKGMGISQKIARYSRPAAPHVRSKSDFFSLRVLEQDLFCRFKRWKKKRRGFSGLQTKKFNELNSVDFFQHI